MRDINLNRRKLIKAFGTSGLAIGMGGAPFLASADGGSEAVASTDLPLPGRLELGINIVSSSAVPGESVVIRNGTTSTLVIKRFLPGHVIFGNKVLDLNALLTAGRLEIAPSRIISFSAQASQLDAASSITEYLWAEESQVQISDDAVLLGLGAFLAGEQAVVFSDAKQSIAQDVATVAVPS